MPPINPPSTTTTTTTSKSAPANLATTSAQADVASTLEAFTNKQLSSPHELTDFVDQLLDTLQGRFDEMKGVVDEKMSEMGRRIDILESSIEELIQGQSAGRE